MHAISRRLALLALGALTFFGTGCGDDDPSGPGGVTGTWTLRSVNGQNVPATVYEGSDLGFQLKVEVLSGRLTLSQNGTFQDVTTVRQTIGTGPSSTDDFTTSGTWVQSGSTITLTDPGEDETYTLTVQGDGSLVQSEQISGVTVNVRYVKQ